MDPITESYGGVELPLCTATRGRFGWRNLTTPKWCTAWSKPPSKKQQPGTRPAGRHISYCATPAEGFGEANRGGSQALFGVVLRSASTLDRWSCPQVWTQGATRPTP